MTPGEFNALPREQQVETFRALPADEQKAVLADMRRQANEKISDIVANELAGYYESILVPSISFKTPSRIEVGPPAGDPDKAARDFFKQFPETRAIRIGNTLYERG
jgi:hypothetical protein